MGRGADQLTAEPSSTMPLQALGEVEGQLVKEELALAAEQARLGEAWSLLHERVELCRRQDEAAQAECQ